MHSTINNTLNNYNDDTQQTHFGFEQVNIDDKEHKVKHVFSSVAPNYDIMNDIMSGGLHRLWKKITIGHAAVKAGDRVLDIASGTGDLAEAFYHQVNSKYKNKNGEVWMTDINADMLQQGKERLLNKGIILPNCVCNAEDLPFKTNYFDVVSLSFGLRNMTHKDKALQEMYRVLKPGGKLLVLEFSKVQNKTLEKIYDWYSFNILPFMGKCIAKDADSYRYLAESIRMHPNQEILKQMMLDASFNHVNYHNITAGVVALHIAYKY